MIEVIARKFVMIAGQREFVIRRLAADGKSNG